MAEIVIAKAKEGKEDKNIVTFTGHMVSRKETKRCLTVYFRTTTMHGKRKYTNSMTILVFDPDLNDKVNAIPLRTKAKVTGYITSTKKKETEEAQQKETEGDKKRETGEEELTQYFVMSDIIPVADSEPDENCVEVIGTVRRAFVTRRGRIVFRLSSVRDGRFVKTIRFIVFPKEGIDYISMMAAGTKLHITGHCSTHIVTEDDGTKYVENIIIDDVEKA